MSELERQLLELLRKRSLRKGTFKLASGDTSDYYIDVRMTQVYSKGAALLGEVLYERTRDLKAGAIGGLEVGAVPLATAAAIAYHAHGEEMEGFWVRSEVKQHGTKKLIEGGLAPGSRVVVVDDVITRGESAAKAIRAVRDHGCAVVRVVTIVDRLGGAAEVFRQLGVPEYQAVFTINDVLGADGAAAAPGPTAAR